jgi:DNA replication and repair protein RecF
VTLALSVDTLRIQGFRNIADLTLNLAPRVNVIAGDNGQGKTSVLEALYFLATSRSFRSDKIRDTCQEGAQVTHVEGLFTEGPAKRRQHAVISGGRRSLLIDNKKFQRLASYAVRTPIVAFHPGDLELVSGAAEKRRTLLDRIALFIDPASGDARVRYAKAQKERQRVLELSGVGAVQLDVYEQLMAEHGSAVHLAREQAIFALRDALLPAFATMAPGDLALKLQFLPGGSPDAGIFQEELRRCREGDRRRKSARYGPQRDDLELTLDGRSARRHASQGQQRVLTLALKVAELECVKNARGAQPILLLDDVSSELDPTRTGAVYDFIRGSDSQVLVTTTRPDLFQTPGLNASERHDFKLRSGALISDPG